MGYTLIDDDTGEVRQTDDDFSWYFGAMKDDNKRKEYLMTFDGMALLARDKELNGTDWRVFTYLCEKMDSGGWADIPKDSIAREIGSYRPNVHDSIVKLIAKRYITESLHPDRERMILRIEFDIAGWGSNAVNRSRGRRARRIKDGAKNFDRYGNYHALPLVADPATEYKKPTD